MLYRYTAHAVTVMAHREIKESWIEWAIENPSLVVEINEREKWCFATIAEADGKCLKVVLNPVDKVVVTAYFDRNRRKKGCR